MLHEAVRDALAGLPRREREVMELRFGLEDGRVRTLEEVGKAFGVTRERIRQIEAKTLAKLRHPNCGPAAAGLSSTRPEVPLQAVPAAGTGAAIFAGPSRRHDPG
jgi:hypothetical protein